MSFAADFSTVVVVLVFLGMYKLLTKSDWLNPTVALLVAILITILLVIPYDWFKYMMFILLFFTLSISGAKVEQFWKGPS